MSSIVNLLLTRLGLRSEKNTFTLDETYPDDVFIVSYPKSGNTWVRFLIGNYITKNQCTFDNIHRITPNIHDNPDDCKELGRPRFIKSHAPYRPQYPNVIYVVRDGRDIAVSYYHYRIRMGDLDEDGGFSTFLKEFDRGEIWPYGTWSEHVRGWLDQEDSNILVIKYEDLLNDAEHELRRMLDFSGIDSNYTAIKEAVEASNFDRLKKIEEQQKGTAHFLSDTASDKPFIRSGQKKEWEMYFSKYELKRFLRVQGDALERLGYDM